jgi:hypothetical protein
LYCKRRREKEYLRVERSFLNSVDKENIEEELTAIVLGECHDEKIEEKKEYIRGLKVD